MGLTFASILLAAVVASGVPPTQARPDPTRVSVSVSIKPKKLVLGGNETALVRVRATYSDGQTARNARIRLRVNLGQLTDVKRIAPGLVQAVYRPPPSKYPRTAVFAAVARTRKGTAFGWTTLPLWGRARILVKSRRGAAIFVQVGTKRFGPAKADRFGRARVPVIVPPGTRRVKSGQRRVKLRLPPVNRILVLATRATLATEKGRRARILVFAVDRAGKPASDITPRLTADRGTVSEASRIAPGVYAATYRPPAKLGNRNATVSVSIPDGPVSKGTVLFKLIAGPPARLTVRASLTNYTAGQKKPEGIVVRVFDGAGNPARAELVCMTDAGKIGRVIAVGPGTYRADLSINNAFGGKKKARVFCKRKTPAHTGPRAETAVALVPAAATRLTFSARRKSVVADGRTATLLRASGRDAYGNLAPLNRLDVSSSEGRATARRLRDGSYIIRFVPPLQRNPSQAQLKVSAGPSLKARTSVYLAPKPYRMTLYPQLGFFTNFGNLSAPYFSAEAGLSLDFWVKGLFVLGEGGCYFKSYSSAGSKFFLSAVPLLVSAGYRYWVHRRIQVHGTAGVGACLVSLTTSISGQPEKDSFEPSFAAHVSFGAAFRFGPGDAVLFARYLYVGDPGMQNLRGPVGGLAILAGYRFGLF